MPDSASISLPAPTELLEQHGIDDLTLRPLTQSPVLLNLEFDDPNRPRFVTRVLQACVVGSEGRALPEDFFWDLPLSVRIDWLIRIAGLEGQTTVELCHRCPAEACGAMLEIELDLSGIIADRLQPPVNSIDVPVGDRTLTFRLPTGRDLHYWHEQAPPNPAGIVARLGSAPDDLDSEDLETIERRLSDADDLVDFVVTTRCPECGGEYPLSVDLEPAALALQRTHQEALLHAVHTLATAYHWSERDILEMSEHRRCRYLRLLDRKASA